MPVTAAITPATAATQVTTKFSLAATPILGGLSLVEFTQPFPAGEGTASSKLRAVVCCALKGDSLIPKKYHDRVS